MADRVNNLAWLLPLLQTLIFVALAPLFAGWVKRIKCYLQNRTPPSWLQPYRDLRRLFAKEIILAHSASVIFRITPYIVFGTAVIAAAVIPFIFVQASTGTVADAIVLVGLFALGRFFLALAGMDIGTSFGGMGSSREMTVAALAEPAMLMVLFTLAMVANSTNLMTIVTYTLGQPLVLRPSLLFALVALVMVAIAETGRVPVDNPATHLELTMIHEAIILEYTGRHLGLMEFAAQLKLMIFIVLLTNLFFPWGIAEVGTPLALVTALLVIAAKMGLFGIVLAMVETLVAKMRIFRIPTFLAVAFTIALVGMLSAIILETGQ